MTTIPDGNAAMARLIVTQTLEAERAVNGEKKSASVRAWAGVVGDATLTGQLRTIQDVLGAATPTGGTAPFTYFWSGAAAGWTITNPTSQSTAVRANSVPPADGVSTSISCTVTDANGNPVTSASVSAEAYNFGGYE